MKTALLLIPSTNGTVDRETYLSDCIEMIMKEDYMPFSPDVYERYTKLSYREYIKKILPLAEVIFLFVDFGIDENMFNVIDSVDKEKLIYKRTMHFDLSKYVNSLPKILKEVSEKTGIPIEDLQGKRRFREIADARAIYYRRAKECTKESLAHIGSCVGKDHATVLFGLKKVENVRQVIELYEKCYGKTKPE